MGSTDRFCNCCYFFIKSFRIQLIHLISPIFTKKMNAIITGASKGIGRAIAFSFAERGINLALCARGEKALTDTVNELKQKFPSVTVLSMSVDMSKRNDIKKLYDLVSQEWNQVDILVNNAGIYIPGEVHSEEDGHLEETLQVNLMGPYHLSRLVIPSMKKNESGFIFNISSIAGLQAYPNGGSYSISKFALTGLSKALREELKDFGIKVITVYPGATWSFSWRGMKGELAEDRLMEADDIAKVVSTQLDLSDSAVIEDIIIRPQLGDL